MACLTCGTTTSNKGKWNNLPPQGKKKHPNATRTIQQSETPQHIIDRLKEPSFIYEFAKGQEGKLFELSVKALEQLDARDELVKLLGEDEIVPAAVNIKTIASMLLSDDKDVFEPQVIPETDNSWDLKESSVMHPILTTFPLEDGNTLVKLSNLKNEPDAEFIEGNLVDSKDVRVIKTEEVKEIAIIEDKKSIDGTLQEDTKVSESDITIESLTKDYPNKETFRPYAKSLGYPKFKARKLEKMYVELIEFLESV